MYFMELIGFVVISKGARSYMTAGHFQQGQEFSVRNQLNNTTPPPQFLLSEVN